MTLMTDTRSVNEGTFGDMSNTRRIYGNVEALRAAIMQMEMMRMDALDDAGVASYDRIPRHTQLAGKTVEQLVDDYANYTFAADHGDHDPGFGKTMRLDIERGRGLVFRASHKVYVWVVIVGDGLAEVVVSHKLWEDDASAFEAGITEETRVDAARAYRLRWINRILHDPALVA